MIATRRVNKKINLLENIIEVDGVEPEDDVNIDKPFDPKNIDIDSKSMTLDLIYKRIKHNEINMNTDFQRGIDLWDYTKQSRLIESILIRLPLPAFYFDGTNDSNWLVVDGLQRLSTFNNFVIEKTLKLSNLEFLTQFEGFGFDDLPRDLKRRLEEHTISVYVIKPGTPADVKFIIFKRVNTGGLILTPQEIRHAVNQGIPADFIKELAGLNEFKKFGIKTNRMLDRDFVTRFVAFYQNAPDDYSPDLDIFLNTSMSELNNVSLDARVRLKRDFQKSLDAAWDIFNTYAFRKFYKQGTKRGPLNKALFETWAVSLSKLSRKDIDALISEKYILIENFLELLYGEDESFYNSISSGTGDKKKVIIRFTEIENLIKRVLE